MQRVKEGDTVNSSNGVAVSKAAQERACMVPRDTLPHDTEESRCVFEQGLLLSGFQLFSSFLPSQAIAEEWGHH